MLLTQVALTVHQTSRILIGEGEDMADFSTVCKSLCYSVLFQRSLNFINMFVYLDFLHPRGFLLIR